MRVLPPKPSEMLVDPDVARAHYWNVMGRAGLIAIFVHALFALAGWLIGAPLLVQLQIVSIAIYTINFALTPRGWTKLPTILTWFDLIVHSTLAMWIVGPDGGFQYYSWILLPLSFTNVDRSMPVKIRIACGLAVFYLAVDIFMRQVPPLAHVEPSQLALLRHFNLGSFLLAMTLIAVLHARTVLQATDQLRAAADTDVLTGLINRRRMTDWMERQVEQADREASPLAVLLIDVDHFKSINDRYGHAVGDEVLVQVGATLARTLRREDVLARWGGEEFMALLPNADLHSAGDIAERARQAVASMQPRAVRMISNVTITIGIAQWHRGETLEATIHRADIALYRGKSEGRNRTSFQLDSEPHKIAV